MEGKERKKEMHKIYKTQRCALPEYQLTFIIAKTKSKYFWNIALPYS